eukprot:2660408-Pleurochrysis_carterae.AAC.1
MIDEATRSEDRVEWVQIARDACSKARARTASTSPDFVIYACLAHRDDVGAKLLEALFHLQGGASRRKTDEIQTQNRGKSLEDEHSVGVRDIRSAETPVEEKGKAGRKSSYQVT